MKTACLIAVSAAWAAFGATDYPIRTAEFTNVTVTGGFWLPRMETNRTATLWADFGKCEEWRIPNFTNAAARTWGTFKGIPYDDSDVYKVIEGAAYAIALKPDAKLEKYCDELIAQIAKAQEDDGYLYTARTLGYRTGMMGTTRWSNLSSSHELYNVGHMYEAAVAYRDATGKGQLLDVAVRSADLVCRTFGYGPNQLRRGPGHQEIELALCKLYRATGDEKYLAQAKFFLDVRGKEWRPWGDGGRQIQAHRPVLEQDEPCGHAVRAGYMFAGMADVAALTGDADYVGQTLKLWRNIVSSRLYVTGGIGRQHCGEGFSYPFDLPNEEAYCETCSSVATALFNDRLFRTYADGKYMDLFELVVYNAFLSGVSFSGDRFFYPNVLAAVKGRERQAWFGTPCCPVNVVRFIPQIPTYAYATKGDDVYWNLFIDSTAKLEPAGGTVEVVQTTDYPASGEAKLVVNPVGGAREFALKVRIPGWARGRLLDSSLYEQTVPNRLADVRLEVNGEAVGLAPEKGYQTVRRTWKAGDVVRLSLPFGVKRIRADWRVRCDRGRLAVMRGPLVYCAEAVDNGGRAKDLPLAADAAFAAKDVEVCGQKVPGLVSGDVTLVPYYAWANRGLCAMETWFPAKEAQLWGNLVPLATVSPDFSIWGWKTDLTAPDGLVSYRNSEQGVPMPLSLVVGFADGRRYRVLGAEPADVPALQPTEGAVRALTTEYSFAADGHAFTLSFFRPFFGDELDALSRPVAYVTVASGEQVTLSAAAGDSPENRRLKVSVTAPKADGASAHVLVYAVEPEEAEFLGAKTPSWWARDGKTHAEMLADAERDYARLKAKGEAFDADFAKLCEETGGRRYRQLAEWCCRQSFAACRLFRGPDGTPFYYPRENGSGEMIGTVDVIYPQFPHLLLSAPKLAKAILEPVMAYAASGRWPYPYAPHDLGLWPKANGQYYGMKKGQSVGGRDDDASRMPVEECGNMLIMLYAVARQDGNADFAGRWWPTVTKWAAYLEQFGFDPGSQLCTDDFAGHLAHNANLSLKSIMAFASYAKLCEMRGDTASADRYWKLASGAVPKWMEAAKGGRHGAYRLAFDRPETWSQKYNLAWDRFFGFNLFPPSVAADEMSLYREEMRRFGLPLDNRGTKRAPYHTFMTLYTKHDWTLWCGVLTDRRADVDLLSSGAWNFLDATVDVKPLSDLTWVEMPSAWSFFARSVVGGVLFPALDFRERNR